MSNQKKSVIYSVVLKTAIVFTSGLALSTSCLAADILDGTVWKTIDDKTGKPKATVKIKEVNGLLEGRIVKLLDSSKNNICSPCKGKYSEKSLKNVAVFWNLKPDEGNEYVDGKILDPKTGKTYNLKGELSINGKTLKLRGYIGVSLFGRTQTWHRVQ